MLVLQNLGQEHLFIQVKTMKLSLIHRNLLYITWTILSITGLYFAYFQDFQENLPTVFTLYTLKIHGVFSSFFLILLGSLIPIHIQLFIKIKRNLKTGLLLLLGMFLLSFSGIFLYYISEELNFFLKILHIGMGIVIIFLLPTHIYFGIKRK